MVHPRFVKYYALSVCVFAAVMLVLFTGIAGMGLWYIAYPATGELKDFTYEKAGSAAIALGLKEENRHIFTRIDPEDFKKHPDYYYTIARSDEAVQMPEMAIRMLGCSVLFTMVLVMHLRLWRRMKGMGA